MFRGNHGEDSEGGPPNSTQPNSSWCAPFMAEPLQGGSNKEQVVHLTVGFKEDFRIQFLGIFMAQEIWSQIQD